MMRKRFCVPIIESEVGWGPKVDSVKYFTSLAEAEGFRDDYNRKYNPNRGYEPTPDWYMIAGDVYEETIQ